MRTATILHEVHLESKVRDPYRYWYYEFSFDRVSGEFVSVNSDQFKTLSQLFKAQHQKQLTIPAEITAKAKQILKEAGVQ